MKPISKETIEHADDFIFRLNDSQVKELMEDFKKKQFNIWKEWKLNEDYSKTVERIDFTNRIVLVIFHAFNDYEVSVPPFSLREIDNCTKWWDVNATDSDDDEAPTDFFLKMGEAIKQKELCDYIVNKFIYQEETFNLFNKTEFSNIIADCITIAALYSQKIKRLLPESSN